MIGVLIDQMMYTYFEAFSGSKWDTYPDLYRSFRSEFRYPKLVAHPVGYHGGMASPSWFLYHGWDKNIDWQQVSKIAKILLNDLYDWLNRKVGKEELSRFKKELKRQIGVDFQEKHQKQMVQIVELGEMA